MIAVSPHSSNASRCIVVALSGGVDSGVAAALLRQQHQEIIGVTLRLQECNPHQGGSACGGEESLIAARSVAQSLGIPHYEFSVVQDFEQKILWPAWQEYAHGRTPNPCLCCNERIKFGMLLAYARELGASQIATGHYARIQIDSTGKPLLLRGLDRDKDQSYFLAGLSSEQLQSAIFPLGELTKLQVRELANNLKLPNAHRTESQDACLVMEGESFAEMLRRRFGAPARAGVIVDETGKVVGQHEGIHHFTVGQRKGVRVASIKRSWVKSICFDTNTVTITHDDENLRTKTMVVTQTDWLDSLPLNEPTKCQAQVRYRHSAKAAIVIPHQDGQALVEFDQPVRAITPGQAAVFYDGDRILGRGWIQDTE